MLQACRKTSHIPFSVLKFLYSPTEKKIHEGIVLEIYLEVGSKRKIL